MVSMSLSLGSCVPTTIAVTEDAHTQHSQEGWRAPEDTECEGDLLELELDGGTDAVDLLGDVLTVLEKRRELTELVHGGAQKTGNLLQDGLGSEEEAVLARCANAHESARAVDSVDTVMPRVNGEVG